MNVPDVSRRRLLQSGVAAGSLGLTGLLAGCSDSSEGGPAGSRIDLAPAGAQAVIDLDTQALLEDSTVRERINEVLAETGVQTTVDQLLDRTESRVGLDLREINEGLAFFPYQGSNPAGVVLWTAWTQSSVVDAFEQNGYSGTETVYDGKTVYELANRPGVSLRLGVLESGVFVLGRKQTVRSVLDRWNGSGQAVGGEIREGYTRAEGGRAQFAFDVPTEELPQQPTGEIDPRPLRTIRYGYGSVTSSDTFRLNLQTESRADAEAVVDLLENARARLLEQIDGRPSVPLGDQIQRLADGTSFRQSTGAAIMEVEAGSEFLAIIGGGIAASFVLGLGQGTEPAPQVRFEVVYDASERTLEIQHTAGDTVRSTELYVRGEGIETGSWAALGGEASGAVDGDPAVVAGDTLVLSDVPSDYYVRVDWERGESRNTLTIDEGPGV